MKGFDYYRELLQMRENYRNHPKRNIRLRRPGWLGKEDPMSEIYEIKKALLQRGEIVYAHIVQANEILFRDYPRLDCPAQIVYSADAYFSKNPEVLRSVAEGLYAYKGRNPEEVPEEWKEAARVITDEYDRSGFTFSLNADGQTLKYNMIPVMVYRKLLPKGKLCGNLLPVLFLPEYRQVLILPKKYWTPAFKDAWVSGMV